MYSVDYDEEFDGVHFKHGRGTLLRAGDDADGHFFRDGAADMYPAESSPAFAQYAACHLLQTTTILALRNVPTKLVFGCYQPYPGT